MQQSSSAHSSKFSCKTLTVLFKMGFSQAIYKLSLISKLKLLKSLEKMMKSLNSCYSHKSGCDLK